MTDISDNQIDHELRIYGIHADSRLCGQIRSYIDLLLLWNKKLSLTGLVDPIEILRFHFGESFWGLRSLRPIGPRLADLGSGPGFPGMPLALASAGLEVTLIEPNHKKAVFLGEVVRRLSLENVRILTKRMEEISDNPPFDIVTVRAVAQTDDLFAWARRSLTPGGRLLLWTGEEGANRCLALAGWKWDAPQRIPRSDKRYIVSGSPIT